MRSPPAAGDDNGGATQNPAPVLILPEVSTSLNLRKYLSDILVGVQVGSFSVQREIAMDAQLLRFPFPPIVAIEIVV